MVRTYTKFIWYNVYQFKVDIIHNSLSFPLSQSAKDGASHFNYVIVDNQTWVHCLLLCCVSMV